MAEVTKDSVLEALKEVYDPEIPVNIVDLGLVYEVEIRPVAGTEDVAVSVKMTLTAMGCAMGPMIVESARARIERMDGVAAATVQLVWDPPWSEDRISEEGRIELGLD